MNQKDRLVQLLEKFGEENGVIMNLTESIAEFLSENGVIVPPCKVGDKVFCIYSETDGEKALERMKEDEKNNI